MPAVDDVDDRPASARKGRRRRIGLGRLTQQHCAEPPVPVGNSESGTQGGLTPEIAEEGSADPFFGGSEQKGHDGVGSIHKPEGHHPFDLYAIASGLVWLAIPGQVGLGISERQYDDRGPR